MFPLDHQNVHEAQDASATFSASPFPAVHSSAARKLSNSVISRRRDVGRRLLRIASRNGFMRVEFL